MTSIAITDHLNTLEQLANFRLIRRDIEAVETDIEVFFGVELNFQGCDGEWPTVRRSGTTMASSPSAASIRLHRQP